MEVKATLKLADSNFWLIGKPCEKLTGDKLPSNLEVISRFCYVHRTQKKTNQETATIISKEIISFWQKAKIPTRQSYNVNKQIKTFYEAYLKIHKHKNDRTKNQLDKENNFIDCFNNVFDIGHANALQMMSNEDDKKFLISQRKPGREGTMKSDDFLAQETVKNRTENVEQLIENMNNVDSNDTITEFESDLEDDFNDVSSGEQYEMPPKKTKTLEDNHRPRASFLSSELASTLDRYKIGNDAASAILINVAHNLGFNVDNEALSEPTIRRFRTLNRQKKNDSLKESFSPNSILTIHWDEKKLRNEDNTKNVNKIAVVVSGENVSKLLEVRELPNGKGLTKATAIVDIADDWGIKDKIKFMCFDTTSSNTGKHIGACVELEKLLGRYVINFACRHHTEELIIGTVFEIMLEEVTTAPDIPLFKTFSEDFVKLDKNAISSGIIEPKISKSFYQSEKNELIQFIHEQIVILKKKGGGRGDYIEFLELGLLFLGETETNNRKIRIHKPQGYSRARWMAIVIYCLKMFLFRNQLNFEEDLLENLQETCIFIVKIYLKNWFLCQLPTKAATNDLKMLKELVNYEKINPKIGKAAFEKLCSHTWYFNEVAVGLAFFDDDLDDLTKQRMVTNLKSKKPNPDNIRLPKINRKGIMKATIDNFVTQKTELFFETIYGEDFIMENSFLSKHPSSWIIDEQYNAGRDFVKSLIIVNDVAETNIALATSFNSGVVQSKEQRKYLLQVVEDNRKKFPKHMGKKKYAKELAK